MTEARRRKNDDWPFWLHEAWQKGSDEDGGVFPSLYPNSTGEDKLRVRTLEGTMLIDWNDYIIRGINGELYPCKEEIFIKTYDVYEEG